MPSSSRALCVGGERRISKFGEIKPLGELTKLRSLTLHGNPIEDKKHYRTCVSARARVARRPSRSPPLRATGADARLRRGFDCHRDLFPRRGLARRPRRRVQPDRTPSTPSRRLHRVSVNRRTAPSVVRPDEPDRRTNEQSGDVVLRAPRSLMSSAARRRMPTDSGASSSTTGPPLQCVARRPPRHIDPRGVAPPLTRDDTCPLAPPPPPPNTRDGAMSCHVCVSQVRRVHDPDAQPARLLADHAARPRDRQDVGAGLPKEAERRDRGGGVLSFLSSSEARSAAAAAVAVVRRGGVGVGDGWWVWWWCGPLGSRAQRAVGDCCFRLGSLLPSPLLWL